MTTKSRSGMSAQICLIVGGKRKGENVVDGAMIKFKKKMKLAEAVTEKKLETITVDKKPNKNTAVGAAG